MNKNTMTALVIATVVILGPFRLAYVQADITKPLFTMAMFLLTVAGTLAAMMVGMKTSK
ncbi:MAG: hypothetical protein NT150_02575 [Bacteroidetes bacterium]|nr:hypothetical protein [Bacteroidota bacterium]